MSYVRERLFMLSAFSASLRNSASEHAWGGDNGPIGGDLTLQGTSFGGDVTAKSAQIVGRVTSAGTSPPGGDLCTFAPQQDNSTVAFLAAYNAATTNWKRNIDETVNVAGAEAFAGEDYAAVADELQAKRDHIGNSINTNVTITLHGEDVGT